MSPALEALLRRRLLIVSGKGGSGKTSISAALALLALRAGIGVSVVELASETLLPRLLVKDAPPDAGLARREPQPLGAGLSHLRIVPQLALLEYLESQLHAPRIAGRILDSAAIERLVDAAPGWRDLIALGKIRQLTTRETGGQARWPLLIVDAPATGHGLSLLSSPVAVETMVRRGSLRRQIVELLALLRDPARTLVLPVTLAEELPTNEALELCQGVRALGVGLGPVIANCLEPRLAQLPRLLDASNRLRSPAPSPLLEPATLRVVLEEQAARRALQEQHLERLARATGRAPLELPYLTRPIDGPEGSAALADALEQAFELGEPRMSAATWLERKLLVTVGTGGVGKTTVAAALALEAARRGRRTLVMTIDPARRLADALGLSGLDHHERVLPEALHAQAGIAAGGSLSAMMLDTRLAFDELVLRLIPDPALRARIQANAIYRNLSDALAGSREYSALDTLYELDASGRYDLIVVDTPPATHVLDFLDAPRRLARLMEGDALPPLLRPAARAGRLSLRILRSGSETALRALERITGSELLTSLADFLALIEAPLADISRRAQATQQLLRSPRCGFVLVASPEPGQVDLARDFASRLADEQIQLLGAVFNRVHTWPGGSPPQDLTAPEREALLTQLETHPQDTPDVAATSQILLTTAERRARIARRDQALCAKLEAVLPLPPDGVCRVPLLAQDICALDALLAVATSVFGT